MRAKPRGKPSCGRLILAELLARTRRAERRVAEAPWDRDARFDVDLGPRYSPRSWFGCVAGAERDRFRRTLYRLARFGFVEIGIGRGGRLIGCRFTPAGRAAAERWDAMRSAADPADEPGPAARPAP